ncbi:hypothetical protein SAMN05216282_10153 [Cryobacterium psychrotolerans]|uniref:S1 motif domain-containing protein n=1 Tax=Cryobacterium psychrotolerans TaxID=386301 RepID=A0A1G8X167_9MICO|nr:hypothetical protein [Cryobacterium psychrotolerans]TFD83059.1 hypothetical protein E3T56_15155 [Cryobacterium psychrotolerans]SDJ84389.1 hypothetical protein SAMN05216282_10153 [Cryobacterium psychrotolerans]
MTYTRVESSAAVQQLAAGLQDAARARPWVVVTSRFGSRTPDILLDQLAEDIADVTEVFLLETGALTRELSDLLPDRFQVYGGAGRSYPVGADALTDIGRSRLRFAYDNPQRATEQLVTDALAHAHQAGLFARAPASARPVTGTVKGFLPGGSRALVELAGGGIATIWQELTYPPVPLDWTLERGQRVDGLLDLDTRRLNVEVSTPSVDALAERFPHNSITLALVQHVSKERAALALHPHVPILISRSDISPNPLDQVDTLLSEGDVVAVRVVHLQSGSLHLRLTDVDDDEPVLPPLALVSNGPCWLCENRPLVAAIEPLPDVDLAAPPLPVLGRAPVVESWLGVAPVVEPVRTRSPGVEPVEARAAGAEPVETPRLPNGRPPAAPCAAGPRPGPGVMRVVTVPVPAAVPVPAVVSAPAAGTRARTHGRVRAARRDRRRIRSTPGRHRRFPVVDAAFPGRGTGAHPATRGAAGGCGGVGLPARPAAGAGANDPTAASGSAGRTRRTSANRSRTTQRAAHPEAQPAGIAAHRCARAGRRWIRGSPRAVGGCRRLGAPRALPGWVDRVGATERATWSLPDEYALANGFADSLASLDDGQLAKAFKACVDVLTGRVGSVNGRQQHALREGTGGASAARVRSDGARCLRVAIEQHTPAARRLHYWLLPGGGIEFVGVRTHDELEP